MLFSPSLEGNWVQRIPREVNSCADSAADLASESGAVHLLAEVGAFHPSACTALRFHFDGTAGKAGTQPAVGVVAWASISVGAPFIKVMTVSVALCNAASSNDTELMAFATAVALLYHMTKHHEYPTTIDQINTMPQQSPLLFSSP